MPPKLKEKHPEALSQVDSLPITADVVQFVTGLSQDIEYHKGQRSDWEARIDRAAQLRYGIRNKVTFPWPGAANYVLPLSDSDINRLKPAYVQLAYGVNPIVTYDPFGAEDVEPARKRELLRDWQIKKQMEFFRPYVIGVDKMLEKGSVIFKVFWKFSTRTYTEYLDLDEMDPEVVEAMALTTDAMIHGIIQEELRPDMQFEENDAAIWKAIKAFRSGDTKIEIEFVEREHDEPCVSVCDPREDIVVPVDTQDINDALFIDYRYWIPKNSLKQEMRDGKFQKYEDSEISSWTSNQAKGYSYWNSARDGVVPMRNDEMVLMHETCVWYDTNNDGIQERCIVNWPDSAPGSVLRFIGLPYDHGMWPYTQVRRELVDEWFYASRGIPALDEDFQVGMSTQFNQSINAGTITTTPTWITRKNSVKNLRNLRYIPGQWLEVEDPTRDARLEQNVNVTQQHAFANIQMMKGWANERIGNLYAGLTQPQNPTGRGKGGNKTATEVDATVVAANQVTSLDLMVFQMQMQRVYYQIDALYEQFGAEEEEIMVGERPMKVSRREIQGRFHIVPTGKFDNSMPALRSAKTFRMYQLFANDPDVKQYELKKVVADDIDPLLSKRIFLTEQERMIRDAQTAQAMEMQKRQAIQEQMTLRQMVDRMEIGKQAALASIGGGQRYGRG